MVQAIPMAIMAAGSIVKGLGANAAAKANARTLDANADAELNDGVAREAQIRDDARLAMGQQVAAQGESGFQQGAGSALDALTQSQINSTLDALRVRREAGSRALALRAQAKTKRKEGTSALIGMGFDVANTIVGNKADWASASAGSGMSSGLVDPRSQGRRAEPGVMY